MRGDVEIVLIAPVYLDLGFDFTSEPDASHPLLPEPMNEEDFSFPRDGLGTRLLPEFNECVKVTNSSHFGPLLNSPLLVALTYADDLLFNGPPFVSIECSVGINFDNVNNVLKSSVTL